MLDTEENGFDLAMVSRGEVTCLWPQTDIFRYSCSLLILTYSEISKNELLDDFQVVIFFNKISSIQSQVSSDVCLIRNFNSNNIQTSYHVTYFQPTNDISIPFYQLFYLQILYSTSEVEVSSNIYERHKQKITTELRRNKCTSIDTFLLIYAGSGNVFVV